MLFTLNSRKPLIEDADCYIAYNATVIGSVTIKKQVSIVHCKSGRQLHCLPDLQ